MKKSILSLSMLLLLTSCVKTTSSVTSESDHISSSSSADASSSFVLPTYEATKEVILTTGDQAHKLENQLNLIGKSQPQIESELITIGEEQLSKVKLFGAALTHASAHQLMLDKSGVQRKDILTDLFTDKGANFNAIRVPIGASDFHAEEHVFTCCDNKGESDLLEHFTLAHDQEIIQVIKEIYQLKPDLKIIAVPWSAPEWMKVNTQASSEDLEGPKLCGGTLSETYISTFASYLNKWCYAYADEGIEINYLCLQNEPTFNAADYPCMLLSPAQANTIARQLNATLPEWTSLMAYDHNCEDKMYTYLEDEFSDDNYSMWDSIAIHGYGSQSIPSGTKQLKSLYPDKDVIMTEVTEWEHDSSFANDLMYVCTHTTNKAYQNGLSGTLYWNLALDSLGEPNIGQKSICYGVVNIDQNADGSLLYTKRPAYYGLASLSHLLDIDDETITYAIKTECNNPALVSCAFKKGYEYMVSIANTSNDEIPFSVKINDLYYSSRLPGRSVISFSLA